MSSIGSAPYAASKHAAVAFAEWLSITYGGDGIHVSCLCPQGVETEMFAGLAGQAAGKAIAASGRILTPEEVADAAVRGIDEERFLILPHPEVAKYEQHRALDRERWLAAMRALKAKVE